MKSLINSSQTAVVGALLVFVAGIALIACSSPEPTATAVPPTPTPVPPTATPVPPTPTPVPPTPTPVPPTPTPVPPTPTPVPPTATPEPPTATPEPESEPEASGTDDISTTGLSPHDAVCIEEHADKETADKIFEAVGTINAEGDVQPEHILDLLDAADTLTDCELMPARFAPIVAQISREDAACVIEQSGVEQLMSFFTLTEEQQSQTLNLMALSPLLGALQACDVSLDLSVMQ